jgi:hypothetical protein
MGPILRDNTFRISEGKLRFGERDPMLFLVPLEREVTIDSHKSVELAFGK